MVYLAQKSYWRSIVSITPSWPSSFLSSSRYKRRIVVLRDSHLSSGIRCRRGALINRISYVVEDCWQGKFRYFVFLLIFQRIAPDSAPDVVTGKPRRPKSDMRPKSDYSKFTNHELYRIQMLREQTPHLYAQAVTSTNRAFLGFIA
jgi:hypothetical protein